LGGFEEQWARLTVYPSDRRRFDRALACCPGVEIIRKEAVDGRVIRVTLEGVYGDFWQYLLDGRKGGETRGEPNL